MKILPILIAAGALGAVTSPASAGDRWSLSDRHSHSSPQTPGGHSTGFNPPSSGGWSSGGVPPKSDGGSGAPTPVPEPASMAILGSGLAALAAARLRRRRAK